MTYRIKNAETGLVVVDDKKRSLAKKIRNKLEVETGQKHILQRVIKLPRV